MAGFKITAAIGKAIRAAKDAGRSDRAIAKEIAEAYGISLSHRAVGQYLQKTPAKTPRTSRESDTSREGEPSQSTLDEIETLQERVRDLNERLSDPDIEPRLIAPLNAELRQTFASIRKADKARAEAKSRASGDTAWVVAKLKRFVSMKATGGAAKDDDAGVPPAAGVGGG